MFKAFDFKEVTQKLDAEFICASLTWPHAPCAKHTFVPGNSTHEKNDFLTLMGQMKFNFSCCSINKGKGKGKQRISNSNI